MDSICNRIARHCMQKNQNKIDYQYELPAASIEETYEITPLAINIQDSLIVENGKGEVIEFEYEGVLPAADGPGIQYDLELWKQEHSEKGVFWLSTTYLESVEDGEDHSYITEGRFNIIHRTYKDRNEVVYELAPLDGSSNLYFAEEGENLVMLDQEMNHISSISNHNYSLSRRK